MCMIEKDAIDGVINNLKQGNHAYLNIESAVPSGKVIRILIDDVRDRARIQLKGARLRVSFAPCPSTTYVRIRFEKVSGKKKKNVKRKG